MQAWTFQSTRKAFSNFLAEIWARTTVNTSSLVFILLLLFLSPVQIFLQIWARQSTADAFNLLYAIDDYSDLPLAFEVLVPGGPLLSCFEIPPAGTSFETYCDTIWNNVLAINQSSSFQAVETTVAAAKASTVFDDYVALARPTGPPSVLAGKERKRPNGNGKFGFGFRGDQDRPRPGGGRKQNGMGQGNNRATPTPSISQTSTINQGMLFSSGIVSLAVGYNPETIVGQPNEPTVTAPSPLPTDTSSSTAFITVVLTGDSVVNVPTQLQLTASALPIATSVDSISQSTSSLPTSISTLTEGSSLSTALPVPTDGNGPQNLSQGKGKPGFGHNGSGRKKPTGVSTSRIRPSPSSNGTNKGGKNHFGTGRPSTSSGVGKGKNPFRSGAPQRRPTVKAKPTSLFPAPKKGLAAVFKPHAKRKPFVTRQAQNQTSGGSSPDADGDNDGDGADDEDDDVGDQDPDNDNYNYSYINATFVVPFNGKNIILQPQFDQAQTNGSSSRRPRFLGMTLTGLHSAPFGTADVTFIAVPCIRGLVWAEQSLGHTLKECSLVMGFWAWIGVVGLLAVWIQSISLMITSFIGLLISLLLLVFQLLENQFFELEYQRAVVNGVCGGVDVIETYPNMRPDLQFGAIGIAFVSMLLTGVCARFLVPIFGAEMRAKLEGLPALNRPYRLMITLKVLFELLSFIIPATAVMWLDSVFTSLPSAFSQDNELEEALFSSFAGFVIPWLMLGYEATRRSLCRTMIIFIVLTLPILAGWSAFFVVDLYRVWLVSWQFLAVLPVVAITLTTVVLVLGTIYRLDFKRGLPQLMGHCAPKDGSPVITTTQPDLERAASAGEEKVPNVGVQPKVQFDIPSTASAKSVEVEEGPSTDEGAVNDTELWTPKRARDAAPSAWTPGRLKGIFRNSGSTMTRDRARPSRTSSVFGPGPASIASFSGSGTAPPSSYLASIKNQPTSPHYTDSSVDLSDRGPRRTPRKTGLPNAPPRPARPPRLNLLRDSVWTEESSKESDAEAGPAAKQDVRTGIGPEGGLRVAGRFALGLKRLYTLPPTFQMRTSMAKQQQTVPASNARNHHRVEPMPASVAEALPGHHILISFLATQSQISLTRLYSKPSACLALFRSVTLPDELTTRPVEPTSVSAACLDAPSSAHRLLKALERQIVMNYLWLEGPVSSNTMEVWVTREGRTSYEAAMRTLSSLQIIPASKPGSNMLQLAPSFKKNFRLALTGGGDHMSFGVPSEKDPAGGVTVEMLDRYAANCWESILHFMVSSGTDGRASRPTKGILYLLDRSGLMAGQGAPKITSQGFQFLLTSPHAQLWTLLLQYLAITNERNIDMMEVIQFLFMLSTMQLGQEYSTELFSTTHHSVLEDLIDYGLVYKRNPNRIYPTRLATTLTSASPITTSPSAGSSQAQTDMNTGGNSTVATAGGGFIILETNYRLYAYTENPLQIAILNLFVSLRGRFSNLVTGSITRESVRKALDNGITADQIISYLLTHAHPQMHKNNPLLPITVQDQIRLWEQEKNRVQIAEGYLWKEFTASTDYNLVLDHAKSTSSVVWENEGARMFFVTPAGHISCRDFVNQRMREGGGFA